MSETDRHRHLVQEYVRGNGVDLGSSGSPITPWAIQVDLPDEEFLTYNHDRERGSIHWQGDATDLPFKDHTLDFVHASHLLEDFKDWGPVLHEWDRVLKPGGYLIIAVPDRLRFRRNVMRGLEANPPYDCDNLSHRHEARVGEVSEYLHTYEAIRDDFVDDDPECYSILYVGRKPIPEPQVPG